VIDGSEKTSGNPDPERIATQQDFGRELTLLRNRAGLTVRQVAREAGLPISTVGDYFSGRHLPAAGQPEQMLKLLRACGETDPARLEQWISALGRARRPPGRRASSADAPYRGLASFEPQDARWFFGREEVTQRLVELAASAEGVPLIVVGASGSGKSSLLRAGLIPHLGGPVTLLEPGAAPAAQLAELTAAGPRRPPVVIVDQLEAIFTRCPDEDQRQRFIDALGELAKTAVVVLALRADFYDRALHYPGLARALQARQVVLGAMTEEQVRRAIVEPARLARLEVADGLADVMLRDLAPRAATAATAETAGPQQAAYEPGALPLLSHALLATWEHSHGNTLTVADYRASGGIRDAVTRTAERAYDDLSAEEKELARRLFLRLVYVADDAPPTRRTAGLSELRGWGGASVEHVLGRFVDERLITVDADTARFTHDALLTAWPRLRSWIDAGLENLRTSRRIGEAARAWEETGRESSALWRGSQLAIAEDWAEDTGNRDSAGTLAGEFVAASIAAEQARERAERSRTRGLQRLVAALTALVIAVLGLAVYAFQQREAVATARDDADSREVAIEASQVRGQDVPLAAQLSAAAYAIAPTPQAAASLLESSGTASAARLLDSAGVVESVGLSPDRRLLAVAAADGTLRLWNVATPGRPAPVGAPLESDSNAPLYTTSFSPDGRVLAAAGAGRTISLWDVSDPAHPVRLGKPLTGPANTIYSVAFSPNGRILAAGSADDTVRLWDVSDPARPVPLGKPLTGPSGYVQSVAFAPSGRVLAAGSADDTVRLWDVADPARPVPLGKPLTGPANVVTAVAFSPDGRILAAASQDDKVWLWKVTAAGRATPDGALSGATDWVNAVAFSRDGTTLAAGSSDSSVLVWNLATRSLTARLPHPQPVTSLAWDGGGRLITGDADGTVSVWTLPTPVLLAGSPVNSVAFSPDGRVLAVGSQNLQLWNPVSREPLATLPVPGTFVNDVAFAPGGKVLAASYGNGMVQLWRTAGRPAPLGPPFQASAHGMAESVAFSPDGTILATGGDDGTVRLWSVTIPARPRLLATVQDSGTYVFTVAFAPSGKTLAAASADNLTRLWDIADAAHPVLLGRPLAGPASYAISVAFSPDGSLLAVGSADKTVRLWDVSDPARPVSLGAPLTGPTSYVYSVAFSPDGRTLAAGVTDGTVWLWNLAVPAHPSLLATLTGPNGHVYSVAFAPSGRMLAAASADGTVRLWDSSPAAADAGVCADAGQPLTRMEWQTYVPGLPYRAPCP
jgi:WD40 repeat protein/transcriptional regulator with XRE-family HTH domain